MINALLMISEYAEHFRPTANNNVVSLSLLSPLPIEATENAFILLEIEARRERAVSVWTSVVIEIVRQEIVPPVFTQAYYRGAYNAESGLQFTQVISLSHGYDDTVSFTLDGGKHKTINLPKVVVHMMKRSFINLKLTFFRI